MRRLPIVLLVVLATAAAAEKPRLPRSPLGISVSALLAAFNSGEAGRIRNFIEENYAGSALTQRSAEDRVTTYMQLYRQTQGLHLRRVETAADDAITFLAETRGTGEWYRITCQAEPNQQHRLLGASFRLVVRPAEFRPHGKLTDRQIAAHLQSYTERLARMGLFSGVVIYAKNGQPLWQGAFPFRQLGGKTIAYKLDDRFGLASINKMFVAVAVAQLADEGKLAFSDPLARFLTEYPRERAEKITIHHLLTHTAGIEPLVDTKSFEEMRRADLRTRGDQARFLGRRPLSSAPGEKFHYSNAGYLLLEAVIESVSRQPFEEYAGARIFGPLGMNRTGQGASTAPDLLRFSEGLRSGKLVSPRTLAIMMAPQVQTDEPQAGYGYGMQVENIDGVRVVGHGGGSATVSAQLDIYPDEGRVVIVLSQQAGNTATRVANRARELITQR